ncbi:Gfo/Idh/MocA family oxidoreductase [Agilicoccus flavus]|uniref:Gfo/Idh/MocA family oxidoreductase n=1 Tax=Agilicoccus flavus TaxID=2775968 RepID=UPI001CF66D2C|nr:Gfo/Idh/MocA family oxidoreductase [Agilicoccus flavus]
MTSTPLRVALIGAGRIGTNHARILAERLPGVRLTAVADPVPGAAERLAGPFGARAVTDVHDVFADPDVDAVAITSSSVAHADLSVAAAEAGKAIFCEKPMAMTLAEADRVVEAVERAGVPLQVGFNRRFAADFVAAHDIVASGGIGTPHLLRSCTRDPGLADPGRVPAWTIFTQTLIHDFDLLNWMNPGARAVEVTAVADALVAPDFKHGGLIDTAVVTIRYDNGAIATADASFSAAYGYDVRGEVFGSAGMVTIGDPQQLTVRHYASPGLTAPTMRADTELLDAAYVAEFAAFRDAVRDGTPPAVGPRDAREALRIALGCIESVEAGGTVRLAS